MSLIIYIMKYLHIYIYVELIFITIPTKLYQKYLMSSTAFTIGDTPGSYALKKFSHTVSQNLGKRPYQNPHDHLLLEFLVFTKKKKSPSMETISLFSEIQSPY